MENKPTRPVQSYMDKIFKIETSFRVTGYHIANKQGEISEFVTLNVFGKEITINKETLEDAIRNEN